MPKWLTLCAALCVVAGCASAGETAGPPAIGSVFIPLKGEGVELVVTEVTHLQNLAGYNFIVKFELTNHERAPIDLTRDSVRFTDANGKEQGPNLINTADPQGDAIVARGETQAFSIGGGSATEEGVIFSYRPASDAEPLKVALNGARANPQSPFFGLDLAPAAADAFAAPLKLTAVSAKTDHFINTMFNQPEAFLSARLVSGDEDIGHLAISVHDDPAYAGGLLEASKRFFSMRDRRPLAGLGERSTYAASRNDTSQKWQVQAGFAHCHAVVDLRLSIAQEALVPDEQTLAAALGRLRASLEPLVCP